MKTSKDICQKCHSENLDESWVSYEERCWADGDIWCIRAFGWLRHDNPVEFPPEKCPYAAEHVVLRKEE